jgi:hypothetical protein
VEALLVLASSPFDFSALPELSRGSAPIKADFKVCSWSRSTLCRPLLMPIPPGGPQVARKWDLWKPGLAPRQIVKSSVDAVKLREGRSAENLCDVDIDALVRLRANSGLVGYQDLVSRRFSPFIKQRGRTRACRSLVLLG